MKVSEKRKFIFLPSFWSMAILFIAMFNNSSDTSWPSVLLVDSQKSRILIISCFYLVIQSYFGKLHSTFNYHFFSVVISEKKIEIADHYK
jgi:hypothetical protein